MYIYTKKCGNEIILKANVVDVEELVCVSVMYGFIREQISWRGSFVILPERRGYCHHHL
jgi:hypothetical protein